MPITSSHIKRALSAVGALGGQMRPLDELAKGANEALLQAPKELTIKGAAAFLATMAQESAWFRTTEEYAKNGPYAPYIGRTFEQITWKNNYRAFGHWCQTKGLLTDPEQFVKSPKALADYKWAWLGGVWFFQANSIWPYANKGDFLAVQRAVNLGDPNSKHTPSGYPIRKKAYDAFLSVDAALLFKEDDMPLTDADVEKIAAEVVKQITPLIPTPAEVAKAVVSGDNVPAPPSTDVKKNPNWNLYSYLQNIYEILNKKV